MPSGDERPRGHDALVADLRAVEDGRPIPMRHQEPIVQPWRVTECPTVTWSASTVGCRALNTCTTQLSWMFVCAPMRMECTSPRTTAFIHTLGMVAQLDVAR
jgi:hypothetical protein